jgi:DNA-binding beta-propeller fold protein YncE
VADANNQRVQQLSASTGKPTAVWTRTGTGLLFKSPTGVAVDPSGNIYVTDGTVNGRLYKLTPSGLPDQRWQTTGNSGGFEYKGVAVGSDGAVYVADEIDNQVVVLSPTGGRRSVWIGSALGSFDTPTGLSFARGSLYVADTGNDRIVELSPRGETTDSWGAPGAALGEFTSPAGVAVDAAGSIYVVDSSNDTLQKISAAGNFIAQWGGSGSGNGQFSSPSAVAVDRQGHIYVADTGNNRIEELSSDGSFIRAWGTTGSLPGQFQSPGGIAVDAHDNIYVADTNNRRIQKFASPQ